MSSICDLDWLNFTAADSLDLRLGAIGALFGCFGGKIVGRWLNHLPGSSICPKRTPMLGALPPPTFQLALSLEGHAPLRRDAGDLPAPPLRKRRSRGRRGMRGGGAAALGPRLLLRGRVSAARHGSVR